MIEKRILITERGVDNELRLEVGWQPSPNHSKLKRAPRLIVLHSAETGELNTVAEYLAGWVAGKARPRASWHFAVDNDSITQSVPLDRASWHAGCVNGYSIGVEQAGRAKQTREQWLDDYGTALLENTARLIAWLCNEFTIPLAFVGPEELAAKHKSDGGAWGITTHLAVTQGFKVRGGHTDPGKHYPMEWVLARADAILAEHGLKY
jgi:N-acetyl-anhydromuramyl-L-alanine amidase AmpD